MTIDQISLLFHKFLLVPVLLAAAAYFGFIVTRASARSFAVLFLGLGLMQCLHLVCDITFRSFGAHGVTTSGMALDAISACLLLFVAKMRFDMAKKEKSDPQ